VPPAHLAELSRLVARVRPPRQGLTEKNRGILRQLDNPARRHDLLTFPQTVLTEVRRQPEITYRNALQLQVALAVELLLMTGLRRANLAGLHLEQHLRWTCSPRGNTVHLVLEGHEVKNGQALAFPLPVESTHLLEMYVRDYRPALTGPDNPFLFPGRGTGAKAAHRLSEQIRDHVYTQTGLRVTTHSFRHIGVKLMLESAPTNYESPRQFLGHRSIATTVQHYAGEERAAHIRRYDALIESQRTAAKPLDLRSRERSTSASRRRSKTPA
jgi:integrase